VPRFDVRPAKPSDLRAVAQQFHALWPEGDLEDHAYEAEQILAGEPASTLPLVVFVAEADGKVVGFVEVGLRSHADGCDAARPVGFLEGWYVDPKHRNRGVGRALVVAAEAWARDKGAREMASDTWLDETTSQEAHAALGYEEVDRCVHFRKPLS